MKAISLIVISLIVSAGIAEAQWVLKVEINGRIPCQGVITASNSTSTLTASVAGQSRKDEGVTSTTFTFDLLETDLNATSTTLTVSGTGACNCIAGGPPGCISTSGSYSGTIDIRHTDLTSQSCVVKGTISSPSTNAFSFSATATLYRKLDQPALASANDLCIQPFNLKSAGGTGMQWYVTDNPDNASHWSAITGATTETISVTYNDLTKPGFTSTSRTVQVRDNSCSARNSQTFSLGTVPTMPRPTMPNPQWGEPSCFGGDNGSVTLSNPSGGAYPNYLVTLYKHNGTSYDIFYQALKNLSQPLTIDKWAIAANGKHPGEFKAGTWMVTIDNNDGSGCVYTPDVHVVSEPTQFIVYNFSSSPVSCKGGGPSDGKISFTASGGPGAYSFTASGPTSKSSTSSPITGLASGTYTVTATSGGCSAIYSPANANVITVGEPATAVTLSLATKNYLGYTISCNGSADGELTATPSSNAVAPFTYQWFSGSGASKALINGQANQKLSGRTLGTYSAKVTDSKGCAANSSELTLAQPPAIEFILDQSGMIVCPGDQTVTLTVTPTASYFNAVSANRKPLTYRWSSGTETSSSVTNRGAGSHIATVTDQQGCNLSKSILVNTPPSRAVTLDTASNYNGKPITCFGKLDGKLRATVKDGTGVFATADDFLWYRNNVLYDQGATKSISRDLDEATYKVVIKYNGKQCSAEATRSIIAPTQLTVDVVSDTLYNNLAIKCAGDSSAAVRASVAGGTKVGNYNFAWRNSTVIAPVWANLRAGKYIVDVKDANGCPATDSLTIINPSPVDALITDVSNYSGYGVKCTASTEGSITAAGAGGTNVFSYQWSNTRTTAMIDNLGAGVYKVTVTDSNGCKDSIEQVITAPRVFSLNVFSTTDVTCHNKKDGIIRLDPNGGVKEYNFSINNGSTWQGDSTFTLLDTGNYRILSRDRNNCTASAQARLDQPTKLNISTEEEPAYCEDPRGISRATVTGGVGAYTYTWKNSQQHVLSTTATMEKVFAGVYQLTVHDAHQCEAIQSIGITSTDGAKSTYSAIPTKCFDSSDGSALITITDGLGPFVIEWPDKQNTLLGSNLKKGTYNVLITDEKDCKVVQPVTITAPEPLQAIVKSQTAPTCHGTCDGELILEASGGVGNYTFAWNNNNQPQQRGLCAGVYPVVIKDANNCLLTKDFILREPDIVKIEPISRKLATCRDGCDGSLEVLATGGNGGYQYTWALGENSSVKSNICHGSYIVSVVDQKGCAGNATVSLDNTAPLSLDLGGGVTLCVGQKHKLDAGPAWKTIQWNGPNNFTSTQRTVVVKEPGQYLLETFNDKGCVARDTFLLETSFDLLQASFMIPNQAVVDDTVAMIDISWPLPESVQWHYPEKMTIIQDEGDIVLGQFTEPGSYDVNLTAHLGECVDNVTKTITILESSYADEGGRLGYEKYVKSFTLHPNPTDGSFQVTVELAEAGPVTLSVWNTTTNRFISKMHLADNKIYSSYFDLRPLAPGTYVLRLDHRNGNEYIRFVVY